MADLREYVVEKTVVAFKDPKAGHHRSARKGKVVLLDDETAGPMLERGSIRPNDGSRGRRRARPPKDPGVAMGGLVEPAPEPGLDPATMPPQPEPAGVEGPRDGGVPATPPEPPATVAELMRLKVPQLSELASRHGVTVEPDDRKVEIAKKLAAAGVHAQIPE